MPEPATLSWIDVRARISARRMIWIIFRKAAPKGDPARSAEDRASAGRAALESATGPACARIIRSGFIPLSEAEGFRSAAFQIILFLPGVEFFQKMSIDVSFNEIRVFKYGLMKRHGDFNSADLKLSQSPLHSLNCHTPVFGPHN